MTGEIVRKVVGVCGSLGGGEHGLLLSALGQLYPVEFRTVDAGRLEGLQGLLVLDGDRQAGWAAAMRGVPSLVLVPEDSARPQSARREIRLGSSAALADCIRGQTMVETEGGALSRLRPEAGDEVLASAEGCPIWTSRPGTQAACQVVAIGLPRMRAGEFLFGHWNGQRFLRLLPVLNFLQRLVREEDWQAAVPRACFVFDDPSLHRPSYGFLDFRLLAAHSRKHGYCVAVATVPLDAWWVNAGVAAVFRGAYPRLSLLAHGNNHTRCEFATEQGSRQGLELAAEARRRMARLERKHQLHVEPIMEPPHGVVANAVFEPLVSLGYEAVLGTTDQFVPLNPGTPWSASIGLEMTEMLDGGLPVLPRLRMLPRWKNDVLLAAFLGQPIVIAGHHQDLADGYEFLSEIARVVGGFKGSRWASLQEIVRSNYKERRCGEALHVKLYSRRVEVRIPPGVKELFLHRSWVQDNEGGDRLLIQGEAGQLFGGAAGRLAGPFRVEEMDKVDVFSPPLKSVDYWTTNPPRWRTWPVVRKALMEVRDRGAPLQGKAVKFVAQDLLGIGASCSATRLSVEHE